MWEGIFEERLQFMTVPDVVAVGGALLRGAVSLAWKVGSSASEDTPKT